LCHAPWLKLAAALISTSVPKVVKDTSQEDGVVCDCPGSSSTIKGIGRDCGLGENVVETAAGHLPLGWV